MGESVKDLKDATKTSFSRVKEHILALEGAIKANREFLVEQNKTILLIREEIRDLMNEFNEFKEEMALFNSSSGNEGVINNHQQSSTTINNNQQQSTINDNQRVNNAEMPEFEHLEPDFDDQTMINNDQQSSTILSEELNNHQQSSTIINTPEDQVIHKPLSEVKNELAAKFKDLTDREFSVFMAVYQLEEQLPDVNYSDVAKMLNISEMTVRGYVNSLLAKKIPLEKRRMYNKKVFLAIPKRFRDLNLASFLLTLRLPHSQYIPQKTLKNF